MTTRVQDIIYICIRGGNAIVPENCRRAEWEYGSRDDYKVYEKPYMLDYDWQIPHSIKRWKRYLNLIEQHQVVQGVAMDYLRSGQRKQMELRAMHLAQRHVAPVIVPKFTGACWDIPSDVIVGISVPTDYAGYLPTKEEASGRCLHLLGGHPDQWRFLINYYNKSSVVSIDANCFYQQAAWGKLWSRNGNYIQLPTQKYDTRAIAVASMRNAKRYINANIQPQTNARIIKCRQLLGLTEIQLPMFPRWEQEQSAS